MSILLTAAGTLDMWPLVGPVHRSIVAVDLEGSTTRTNPVKGELRRILYELLNRALQAAGISAKHLEQFADRGDGVLILIRPYDDVPKTVLLGKLIPMLTALLIEYNATVVEPTLQLRLRTVVHAGEVHDDGRGFYGDDLDAAFRLLDSPKLKKALREAVASPLVLVVSEEIFNGIVQHGYLNGGPYRLLIRVRVGNRQRRGWVHIPVPLDPGRPATIHQSVCQLPPTSLAIAPVSGGSQSRPQDRRAEINVIGSGGPRLGRGLPCAGHRLWRSRRGRGWGRPGRC